MYCAQNPVYCAVASIAFPIQRKHLLLMTASAILPAAASSLPLTFCTAEAEGNALPFDITASAAGGAGRTGDTGGNAGSQASVSIIRGLSLGEVEFEDIFHAIWKEVRVAVLCGLTLATTNFVKLMILDHLELKIAAIVCITANTKRRT